MTIEDIQHIIAGQLRTISDAPELDAQRILLHVLKKPDASYLLAHGDDTLTQEQQDNIESMASKRATGVPLAYILGEADFYGRTFAVTPGVLIPRPDTESLIDTALKYIQDHFPEQQEITIADICTGSGCIAITLALELPHIRIIATDISPTALEIAQQNAKTHGVEDRIEFLEGNLLEPIQNKKIDIIVSNPPYVPAEALLKSGYATDTRGLLFEPKIALYGGEDGLQFVNQIKEYSLQNNIPTIIETVGGEIETVGI